jgi:hypothetical protein
MFLVKAWPERSHASVVFGSTRLAKVEIATTSRHLHERWRCFAERVSDVTT